jgi:hypothetical protein
LRITRKVAAMIFPGPGRDVRHEAIAWARGEKERSLLGAADAAELREQLGQLAKEARAADPVFYGSRTSLRLLAAGHPGGRMECPVVLSGRLADCPVFHSGRLAD